MPRRTHGSYVVASRYHDNHPGRAGPTPTVLTETAARVDARDTGNALATSSCCPGAAARAAGLSETAMGTSVSTGRASDHDVRLKSDRHQSGRHVIVKAFRCECLINYQPAQWRSEIEQAAKHRARGSAVQYNFRR